MGTGSGTVGIFSAAAARTSRPATSTRARWRWRARNARRNGVEMEILASDLFRVAGGRRFDVICFNLPFLRRPAAIVFETAFFGGPDFETVRAFADGCRQSAGPGRDGRRHLLGGQRATIASVSCFADAGFVTRISAPR
jgi:methylase of polypeptide subunit release factors